MTCAECREAFSARVDNALGAHARAALEAHLAGCAECRREWQRFAATVDLLRAVQPERAPAGFVDRVRAAARPQPWYRRVLRGLFVPWPVKLPLEAAALVLVAGLAVMIFQRSPELQQAAVSPPADVSTPEVRRHDDMQAPVDSAARAAAFEKRVKSEGAAVQEARPERAEVEDNASRLIADARRRDVAPPPAAQQPPQRAQTQPQTQQPLSQAQAQQAQGAPTPEQQAQQLLLARRQQLAEPPAAPRPRAEDKAAAPSAEGYGETRSKLAPAARAPAAASAPPPSKDAERELGSGFVPPGPRAARVPSPAMIAAAPAERVELRLTVADRVAAAREIAAAVARVGGTMLPRETGKLELTVPREAYSALTRELAGLGTLAVVLQPRELPQPVTVGITLTE